jgi:hypothetical protein
VTALADLPLIASGKVREMYQLSGGEQPGGERLLRRATDLHLRRGHLTPIPDKGSVDGLSVLV